MTRKRMVKCKDSECPHEVLLKFSDWSRHKLPDSNTGFTNNDIDYIFWNYKTRNILLVEVKTMNGSVTKSQRKLFPLLDLIIRNGVENIKPLIYYRGFHLVKFQNTGFDDGRCLYDNKEVTEEELIKILSMEGKH